MLVLALVLTFSLLYVIFRLKKRLKNYSENKNLLIKNAYFNPLSDLPNGLNIELVIAEQIDRALRHNHTFLLAVVRINNYKTVQKQRGDLANKFILTASNRLLESVRDEDIVGHIDDDTFIVVFNEYLDEGNVDIVLNRIKKAFQKPFEANEDSLINYDITIGLSKFPDEGTDTKTLLQKATQEALK
jgi:diguanylate cyclase (GGDEF)-like protein